jgi:hypothetical protein
MSPHVEYQLPFALFKKKIRKLLFIIIHTKAGTFGTKSSFKPINI